MDIWIGIGRAAFDTRAYQRSSALQASNRRRTSRKERSRTRPTSETVMIAT
jgi:hypothetical protein